MEEELYPQELIDEYLRTIHELEESLSDKKEEIKNLKHQLAVKDRALKLAGDVLRELNYKTHNEFNVDFEEQFIAQAEKELKDE